MRITEAKDSARIGPCDHDEKLKVGDTQHVMFRENDLGPIQISSEKSQKTRMIKTMISSTRSMQKEIDFNRQCNEPVNYRQSNLTAAEMP